MYSASHNDSLVPEISIVMITYNSARFIDKAIESCFNQTFKNFELCISDDASTDETVTIIKKYQSKYPGKIKLNQLPFNLGKFSLAINANFVMSLCSGKYIAVMDPDEYMLSDRLQKQYEFLQNNKDFVAVSHKKKLIDYFTELEIHDIALARNPIGVVTTENLILKGNIFSSCFMMRNIQGMEFNTRLKVMGDWDFIIRLSLLGKLFIQGERMTVKFLHDKNVTRVRNKDIQTDADLTLLLLGQEFPDVKYATQARRLVNSFKNKLNLKIHYLTLIAILKILITKIIRKYKNG